MSTANSENVQPNGNDHTTSEQPCNNTPVSMDDTAATPARDAAGEVVRRSLPSAINSCVHMTCRHARVTK